MEDAKPMKTPMHASNPLSKDELGKPVDQTIYRSMIGSLLYVTSSGPDIMQVYVYVLDFSLILENYI